MVQESTTPTSIRRIALNQEILLNIVRASKFQSANFMAVSQVTGGQTEMLTTGLPTLSIGPGQTAANHVYQISNSFQSTVNGGYQSNPLISTAFQNGMMTPVSPRTVALLVASRPREIVFFLLLSGIEVVQNHKTILYSNDPSQDSTRGNTRTCDQILSDSISKNRELGPGYLCGYTKFAWLLQTLIGNGLTAELVDSPSASTSAATASSNSGSGSGSSGGSGSASGLPGKLCFDPALAGSNTQNIAPIGLKNICAPSSPTKSKPSLTKTDSLSVKTTATGTETTKSTSTTAAIQPAGSSQRVLFNLPGIGPVEFRPIYRSPISVINYLGISLRGGPFFVQYASLPAQQVLPNTKLQPDIEPYLNVLQSSPSGCYTSLSYMGQTYCVPASSQHTPMIMDIVESLRNLNIQPTDLNSAFTVRLTP
jgi:hypothetical protein